MNIAFISAKKEWNSLIYGKTPIYWTVKVTCECEEIDKVHVLAEKGMNLEELVALSEEKINIMYMEAGEDVVSYVSDFANTGNEQDILVYVRECNPLIRKEDLQKGIEQLKQGNTTHVVSAIKWGTQLIENELLYMTNVKCFQASHSFSQGERVEYLEMHKDTALDLYDDNAIAIMKILMRKHGILHSWRLREQASKIKIFLTDCDGCLTDGGMYYTEQGDELKKFNAKDGMGFGILRNKGIKIGIITGENVEIVRRRAAKLKMDEVHCGIQDKMQVVKQICEKYQYSLEQVAYVGDDINDVEVLKAVGLSCSIADAIEEAKNAADYVTQRVGGNGAIREIVDLFFV